MFTINASLLLLCIIYTLWNLQWQTTSNQKPITDIPWMNWLSDFFDKKHFIKSVSTLTKRRHDGRRSYLFVMMISMALYAFQRDEKPFLYLYTQLKFSWTLEIYTYFKTYQSAAFVLMMLIAIPIMNKLLKWRDTVIIIIGAFAHAAGRICFGLATVPWLFYVGATIASLGPTVAPVLRSMTSKLVSVEERGTIFALLSVFDNAVPLFSGVLYTNLYKATINTNPASIFWLTFTTQLLVVLLIMYILFNSKLLIVSLILQLFFSQFNSREKTKAN